MPYYNEARICELFRRIAGVSSRISPALSLSRHEQITAAVATSLLEQKHGNKADLFLVDKMHIRVVGLPEEGYSIKFSRQELSADPESHLPVIKSYSDEFRAGPYLKGLADEFD